jgi:hypothetical protein
VVAEKRLRVLEVVAGHGAREHALRRNSLAVCRYDHRDVARLDHDHRHAYHLEAPQPQTKVPAGRQKAGLIPRLAAEGDDAA